ncbi:fused response regulator/phosphatase [Paenibacillus hunanensis]|uniref:PP2C family protein-serine/threonine phosphatase n=1 Tax=Paenibacillus hunanensis TaxID=539262 RepID=UPI002A6A8181|nr:fused response regulator/phosphatase [Paenibacillus hunanensis]WPP43292.1 fused response regulator/phosphatase [Paenibacillus hunanensis]
MSSILIVDDSRLNVAYLQNILHTAGYEDIRLAYSAVEAFRELGIEAEQHPKKRCDIDLVLLDIVMPDMDGIEACRTIKNTEMYQDLPIIFLTADRAHFEEAFGAGGMDFIEKGGPDYELLARVQSALRLKKEMDTRKNWEEKVQKDLQLAKHLQRSVLHAPLDEPGIRIHSRYMQSAEVSGDMFYWKMFPNRKCGVLLIDVSGHGISAALISMSIRSLLDSIVGLYRKPAEVCAELNRQMRLLFGKTRRSAYFTAIYLLIDLEQRELEYVNAGHPPGLLLKQHATPVKLKGTTVPIGIKPDMKLDTVKLSYDAPCRIVLYTDGLVERPGLSIQFGIDRLEEYADSLHYVSNESFVDKLERLNRNREDDICIVSIELD